ncbi:S-adenosyl-L-methionine-dependent methyltransferase [Vararia minispora EC-137]|uniref:S-adenosyl-L-methionine-dependent methyltransferase n=1 Tax=Vararia minispora EC-137 TaxID=1314806 RepID=A0ACB8QUE5_9AGAM|nr:S-adenosyl-L-methionine-dependent methyltransferase [Vararia minispora EC-137]
MAAQSPLSALLALLTSSVQTLESAYAKQGLSYPSLDAPFAPSPLDTDAELNNIARLAVASAAQIIATIRGPLETIQETSTGAYGAAALSLIVDTHVANIIKEAGDDDQGVHISEIAAKAQVPADSLGRLLRYLSTRHIFREVKPDTFANNRVSSTLIKKHTLDEIKAKPTIEYEGSTAAAFVGHTTDEGLQGAAAISSWVKSLHKNYATPFNVGNHVDTDIFHWFETQEYRARRFHIAATGSATDRFPPTIFTGGYDWASLPKDSIVVDVGASMGSVTLTLIKEFPHLKYILQDLEKVVKYDAPKYWEAQMPSALTDGRVTFQAIDFFEAQPVKNAAVYFMRAIIHDWPDEKAKQIMKVVRDAAGPNSKLVVFDAIMPYACEYTGPFAEAVAPIKAPYPLLANLGLGLGGFVTLVDIQMLNLLNGKERTVGEFIELGKQSGWKLESVKPGMMASIVYSAA